MGGVRNPKPQTPPAPRRATAIRTCSPAPGVLAAGSSLQFGTIKRVGLRYGCCPVIGINEYLPTYLPTVRGFRRLRCELWLYEIAAANVYGLAIQKGMRSLGGVGWMHATSDSAIAIKHTGRKIQADRS